MNNKKLLFILAAAVMLIATACSGGFIDPGMLDQPGKGSGDGFGNIWGNDDNDHGLSVTITFDINGGTGKAPSSKKVTMGSSITLPDGSGFSKSGYIFDGWTIPNDFWDSNYKAGDSYIAYNNVTFVAKWITTLKTVTVTFNINGGNGTTPSPQTVDVGNTIILPTSGFSKTNYKLIGWGTSTSGGTIYNDSYTVTQDITLYAKWGCTAVGGEYNPIPLTENTWANGEITSSTIDSRIYYSFEVTSGTTYYVWWNDSEEGDSSKTLNIDVSALYNYNNNSGNYTWYFLNENASWDTSTSFTASSTGTVKLMVTPHNSGDIGTFGIVYSTSNTRPSTPPAP